MQETSYTLDGHNVSTCSLLGILSRRECAACGHVIKAGLAVGAFVPVGVQYSRCGYFLASREGERCEIPLMSFLDLQSFKATCMVVAYLGWRTTYACFLVSFLHSLCGRQIWVPSIFMWFEGSSVWKVASCSWSFFVLGTRGGFMETLGWKSSICTMHFWTFLIEKKQASAVLQWNISPCIPLNLPLKHGVIGKQRFGGLKLVKWWNLSSRPPNDGFVSSSCLQRSILHAV